MWKSRLLFPSQKTIIQWWDFPWDFPHLDPTGQGLDLQQLLEPRHQQPQAFQRQQLQEELTLLQRSSGCSMLLWCMVDVQL